MCEKPSCSAMDEDVRPGASAVQAGRQAFPRLERFLTRDYRLAGARLQVAVGLRTTPLRLHFPWLMRSAG
jgi:hypothetical protein